MRLSTLIKIDFISTTHHLNRGGQREGNVGHSSALTCAIDIVSCSNSNLFELFPLGISGQMMRLRNENDLSEDIMDCRMWFVV